MVTYSIGPSWSADDARSYFPEWAARPVQRGVPLESERNSYLAGGYAEEFGHHAGQDGPPVFTTLDGDPEESGQWRVQIDALHPGYPECPRPVDREVISEGGLWSIRGSPTSAHVREEGVSDRTHARHRRPADFTVIRVSEQARNAQRRTGFPGTLGMLWKELCIRRRELGGLF